MNRNSFQTYTAGYQASTQHYKSASSGFGLTAAQRAPLYPIGPTLPQPEFKGIQRGTSPYISRQGLQPPSYEQRYQQQTTSNFNQTSGSLAGGRRYDTTKINYEERQRDLISRNQAQIDEEHKRREQIRLSFQREIAAKSSSVSRNMQRKQKLLSQYDALSATKEDLHTKLMDLRPPSNKMNIYDPLDRKQQEMIITKNKLINQMRQKQNQLHKEEEEEQKFWENELGQKERILLKLEMQSNTKRMQLNAQKNAVEKPDLSSLEDQIREERYQDFIFQASEIETKINRMTQEREKLTEEIREGLTLKKPQMHSLRLKREELAREKEEILLRVSDLQRIGKEMEEANSNLLNQLERKDKMIGKYEYDIQELKEKKKIQEAMMNEEFKMAREGADQQLIAGLTNEISSIQDDLRLQQSTTTRLKTQYQRLYELLCSAASKDIHQTFGTIYTQS